MAAPPVAVEFTVEGLEQVKTAFREVAAESKVTAESAKQMDISYTKLAVSVAGVGTAFLAMEGIVERVSSGQMGLLEGALRLIPTLVTVAASVGTLIKAMKGLAIAQTILHALSGPAGWALLAGAAIAAAGAMVLIQKIPEMEYGGAIAKTGVYKLHAGEYVVPSAGIMKSLETMGKMVNKLSKHYHLLGGFPTTEPFVGFPPTPLWKTMGGETKVTNVEINIQGMTRAEAEGTSDVIVDRLRRAGVI